MDNGNRPAAVASDSIVAAPVDHVATSRAGPPDALGTLRALPVRFGVDALLSR